MAGARNQSSWCELRGCGTGFAEGVVSEADSQRFIALLGRLNVTVDRDTASHALGDTLSLARRYRLSAYDAAYLELALRTGLPLATLDASLAKAASAAGVPLFAASTDAN